MMIPFSFPEMKTGGPAPIWTGYGFRVGSLEVPVLEYSSNVDGWTDQLTTFHEESAGQSHFIDKASRSYALNQLQKHLPGGHPVIIEVGCSSGVMLRLIHESLPHAFVMGADAISGTLSMLAKAMPNIPLMQFDLTHCPLADASFDAVVLLNVLEHIDDDIRAMRQVYRILKPGGVAIIEVPAGPQLFDVYDKMFLHRRRYSSSGLKNIAEEVGFIVKRRSHLGFFMYPGFSAVKRMKKNRLTSEEKVVQWTVEDNIRTTKNSALLQTVMNFELFLGKWISYPIGIRCLLSCIKPT